ncbi:MAG: diguanylate cyclase [bacterium]|nr:diguanylate cyclase [bacterium]
MISDNYKRLQKLIENLEGFLYEVDVETSKILFLAGKVEEITGYLEEDFYKGKISWKDLIYPQDLSRVEEERNKLLSMPNYVARSEYRIINKNERIRWVTDIATLTTDGERTIIQGFVQDITKKKEVELELKRREELLVSIFNSIQDGLSILDKDLNIIKVNDKMNKLYPHMVPLEGKKCYFAYQGRDSACSFCPTVSAIENNTLNSAIVPYTGPGESSGWLELYVYPLHNHNGSIVGAVEHVRDITEKKELEERLRFLSFHDILTGLYNRTFFQEELRRLDTSRSLPLGILMGDVDGLKLVNDVFGHKEGDRLLTEAGKILKMSCRKEDIVARWGGDEFVILFPNVTKDILDRIVERIYNNFQTQRSLKIPLSISLGYAIKYKPEEDVEDIVREAESNMYRRKLSESRKIKEFVMKFLLDTLQKTTYETLEHMEEVEKFSARLGEVLGLEGKELEDLILTARLHDIGMITIPKEILEKEKLSQEEWEIIKRHTSAGYRIALSTPEFAGIADYILSHHEHWDGTGYPQGLGGNNIPLISRIISIVDAFVSMREERPYRKAKSMEETVEELKTCSGSQFDPELVKIFIEKVLNDK